MKLCDLKTSYSDEPREECLKALQSEQVKGCFLQDCPVMKRPTVFIFNYLLKNCTLWFVCEIIDGSNENFQD